MIAFLHGAPVFGAVERYVADVLDGLRRGNEGALVVYPDDPALAPFGRLATGRLRAVAFPVELYRGPTPRLTAYLARLLRREHPRLVHVSEIWPAALVAARLAGVRRVLVTHHTPELPRRDNLTGRAWQRLGWLARPEVVYTSEADRLVDRRHLLRRHVVPLGIDLERFLRPGPPALDLPRPVVGNVARLAEQKGQRLLIEAAPAVLAAHPGATFVIVGEGELRPQLERLVRERGLTDHILLAGSRADVPEVLASLDVFAFPSRFEGLCLAVIEAQAAGIPVVATPVGGIRETVVDGETGLLVPVDDAPALARAIVRLVDDREAAARMAGEAQRRAVERYGRERMVAETLRLYA